MEDLRRIGELVSGRVEHLQALGNLGKLGQWGSVLDFLAQKRLASASRISDVRAILQDYEECKDEAALRKRYLQLRVERAGRAAKSLGQEEHIVSLGKRRAELLQLIAQATRTLEELEARKEARLKTAVLAESLGNNVLTKLATASASLQSNCKTLVADDPPILGPPTNCKRSTLIEALVREYIANPQGGELHAFAGRKTVEIMVEINNCLRDAIDALLKEPIANVPLASSEVNKLRNIQQVALELARCIVLARSQPDRLNEWKGRIEGLKRAPVSGMLASSPQATLETTPLAQLRADSLHLDVVAKDMQQQLTAMTDRLLEMNDSFTERAGRLQKLCEELQQNLCCRDSNITNIVVPGEAHSHKDSINLLYIKIKHALTATTPPSVRDNAQELEQVDTSLASQLEAAAHQATGHRDEAERRFNRFQSECQAIERLQGREIRSLLGSIVIKQ